MIPSYLAKPFVAFMGAACFCSCVSAAATPPLGQTPVPPPFYLHDSDRVLFYGDSITEQKLYTNFVETFVLTRFPSLKVTFVNSGWGGDRVTGGAGGPIATRLERDVLACHPTVVTIMLGMNDGAYLPFDEKLLHSFSQGYLSILDTLAQRLPDTRLTLIVPSPYDDITRAPLFAGGYNGVVRKFGQFIQRTAASRQLTLADMNSPVVDMLQKANTLDRSLASKLLEDRIHPGPGGHLIMASALLKAWDAPGLIGGLTIDAAKGQVTDQQLTTVTELSKDAAVTWTQLDQRLPFPVDLSSPSVELAVRSSDFMDSLNRQTLRVTGLPDRVHILSIDGEEIGAFTAAQFSAGLNLAALPTPMQRQSARVAELTDLHNAKHFWRWRQIQLRLPDEAGRTPAVEQLLPDLLRMLDDEEARVVEQQRAAAQPIPHQYAIAPAWNADRPNLAFGKPHTNSHPNPMPVWDIGLTDGVKAGRENHVWASDGSDSFPKQTTIDLGSAATLTLVRVSVPPFGSTKTVEIQVSADGRSFQTIGTHQFNLKEASTWSQQLPGAKARYLRLSFPDHYSDSVEYDNAYVFLSEVEAYEDAPSKTK